MRGWREIEFISIAYAYWEWEMDDARRDERYGVGFLAFTRGGVKRIRLEIQRFRI
jgi:hypothetical protein